MLQKIIISVGLGALIGIEREFNRRLKQSTPIGIRTMILISIFGTLMALLSNELIITGFIAVMILVGLNHYIKSKKYEDLGLTTDAGAFIIYFAGVLTGMEFYLAAVTITVITTIILSSSQELHKLAGIITRDELKSAIILAIIALIILPLLPNENITFLRINPFSFWLIVVLISIISFTSYIIIRVNEQSLPLIGLLGGLVSAKAVITELSTKSKKNSGLRDESYMGVLYAIASSAVINVIIISIITANTQLIIESLIPVLLTTGITLIAFKEKVTKETIQETELKSPFTLTNALKTAIFIYGFTIIASLASDYVSSALIYPVITLSSLASSTAASASAGILFNENMINAVSGTALIVIITIITVLDKFIFIKAGGDNELLKKLTKPLISWSLMLTAYLIIRTALPI